MTGDTVAVTSSTQPITNYGLVSGVATAAGLATALYGSTAGNTGNLLLLSSAGTTVMQVGLCHGVALPTCIPLSMVCRPALLAW